ncbi:hypothetical protein [Sulfurospirillum diekertiae]|uniref:Uncharacterized protein n=1 Tax=Sulfurospirillum diekertiae TaxID=1854492 RepID=A0A1Y0HPE0_9BACT|nr:hypothetical protein [Sulfurospirillum diekertiae]ARU49073.1 hypothetical protein Sdiek1_1914 [Sulfurospirillum diekertiae]ASC93886.1 hypothetical protein Sdiek2_1871 [Sulfurospirillum diekertiae]
MPMILGAALLIYVFVAIGIYKFVKQKTDNKWIKRGALAFFILLPTYDIIITNTLGAYYCLTTPSTYVNKKVEYPISIYWEDNVYPEFDKKDRELMVKNYLNDIRLKVMALGAPDGKVYVYQYKDVSQEYYQLAEEYATFSKELQKLRQEFKKATDSYPPNWKETRDKYLSMDKENDVLRNKLSALLNSFELQETIYDDKNAMPQMNYTVTFNEVRLNPFSRKFLYSDETKIIENQTGNTIAYNRSDSPFFYNIAPDFALGNRYYSSWGWEICESQSYLYYNGDGFKYIASYGSAKHAVNLNIKLYNKYIKGEK